MTDTTTDHDQVIEESDGKPGMISVYAARRILGVAANTVTKWVGDGYIRAERVGAGSRFLRLDVNDVQALAALRTVCNTGRLPRATAKGTYRLEVTHEQLMAIGRALWSTSEVEK